MSFLVLQCKLLQFKSLNNKYKNIFIKSIEACLFGSYPIVPNRLVYPEIYPKECCYSTEAQLLKKLKSICSKPKQFRLSKLDNSNGLLKINFDSYKWLTLKNEFMSLFL